MIKGKQTALILAPLFKLTFSITDRLTLKIHPVNYLVAACAGFLFQPDAAPATRHK